MLNKRKLKYNFGTECILLKTVYNREYIYVKLTKREIYIWFNTVFSSREKMDIYVDRMGV